MKKFIISFFIVFVLSIGTAYAWSDNDYSDEEKAKLEAIEEGAEANPVLVSQADAEEGTSEIEYSWSPLRITQAIAALGSVAVTGLEAAFDGWDKDSSDDLALGETSVTAYRGDRGKTAYDHSQTAHSPAGAEVNVQSDWNEADSGDDAYIANKPTIPTVSDTAYDESTWNDNSDAATKNAIRDKIETLASGSDDQTALEVLIADTNEYTDETTVEGWLDELDSLIQAITSFPGFTSLSADYGFGTTDINTDGTLKDDAVNPDNMDSGAYDLGTSIEADLYTIKGTQAIYKPAGLYGTIVFGDGGGSFIHMSGTESYYNTFVGLEAGNQSTSGFANTALGQGALYTNQFGDYNTAIGGSALWSVEGNYNTAIGYYSFYNNETGSNNTAVGYSTGLGITTGSGNTILGANVAGLASDLENNIIIADGEGHQRINIDSNGDINLHSSDITGTGAFEFGTITEGGKDVYNADDFGDAYAASFGTGAGDIAEGDHNHSGVYLESEVDGSVSNEINTITGDDSNTTSGLGITIAGGGDVVTSVAGDTVTVTLSNDGYEANTDAQDLTLVGNTLAISGDPNTDVDLSGYLDDTDTTYTFGTGLTETNEHVVCTITDTDDQGFDVSELDGTTLKLSLDDDGEATKEIELSSLQDGTGTDDQTIDALSLDGTTLNISLEGDGEENQTVDLSGLQDGYEANTDDQTIDVSELDGTTLKISLEDDGEATKEIDLSSLQDGYEADTNLTEEEVEDYVGTMVDGGTETRITVTYTDGEEGAGLLNFVVDAETDPVYAAATGDIMYSADYGTIVDLTAYPNADIDSTDDFSGSYNDLTDKPTNFDDDDVSAADVGLASDNLDDTDASIEWEDAGALDADGNLSTAPAYPSDFGSWTDVKLVSGSNTGDNPGYDSVDDIPHATPSNGDTTHFSNADEVYDWVIGLGYSTFTWDYAYDDLTSPGANSSIDFGTYTNTWNDGKTTVHSFFTLKNDLADPGNPMYLLELQYKDADDNDAKFLKCTDAEGVDTKFEILYDGSVTSDGTIEGATITEGGKDVYNADDFGDAYAASFGTGSGDIAEGDHNHSGVYEPADSAIAKTDEAETLSANWVNTAHPWADNEIASSGTWNALVTFPGFTSLSADYGFGTADIDASGNITKVDDTGTDDQTAAEVSFDNTDTEIVATDVQEAIDEIEARVDTNDAKNTNVPTALSTGTVNATTYSITSDGGADDLTLVEADTDNAGLLGADKWDEIVANSAKATNVSTALSVGTVTGTTVSITSDGGADDVTIPAATTDDAGLLTAALFDEIDANTAKATNVTTNITVVETPTNVEIQSSDGSNDTIAAADETNAGVMTTTMYDEHVANNAKVTYPGYVFGTGAGDMLEGDTTPSDIGAEPADAAIVKSDEAETLSVGWNLGTPASGTLTNCTFPTLNQNTTGEAGSGDSATAFFGSGTIEHERGGLEADVNAYDGVLKITGGATGYVKYMWGTSVAPTVNDDVDGGWAVGSKWYDTTADAEYTCLDTTDGVAVWSEGGGGGGKTRYNVTGTGTISVATLSNSIINNYGQSAAATYSFGTVQTGAEFAVFEFGTTANVTFDSVIDNIYLNGETVSSTVTATSPPIGSECIIKSFQTGATDWIWVIRCDPGLLVAD